MLIIFAKKTLIITALAALLTFSAKAEISAESAVLYCSGLHETIFEQNADEKMLIASTTKIMTAIVVIENCRLDDEVTVKPEWCAVEGSSMYLKYGEKYTVRELLTGLLLSSGNDAAEALACYTSGDDEHFAELMNDKAAELGMVNSSFSNPHGLDAADHYSTARDMALLADYCMDNETFRSLVSMKSAAIDGVEYVNHNKLLWQYEGCVGLKTGYTEAAGRTLVSCAERNGLRLICVTLNDPEDWDDHKALYDMGFDRYGVSIFSADDLSVSLPVVSAAKDSAKAALAHDVRIVSEKGDSITTELCVPRVLFAGGLRGEKVGELRVFVNGELAATENLVYTESVIPDAAQKLSPAERIRRLLSVQLKPYYIP